MVEVKRRCRVILRVRMGELDWHYQANLHRPSNAYPTLALVQRQPSYIVNNQDLPAGSCVLRSARIVPTRRNSGCGGWSAYRSENATRNKAHSLLNSGF